MRSSPISLTVFLSERDDVVALDDHDTAPMPGRALDQGSGKARATQRTRRLHLDLCRSTVSARTRSLCVAVSQFVEYQRVVALHESLVIEAGGDALTSRRRPTSSGTRRVRPPIARRVDTLEIARPGPAEVEIDRRRRRRARGSGRRSRWRDARGEVRRADARSSSSRMRVRFGVEKRERRVRRRRTRDAPTAASARRAPASPACRRTPGRDRAERCAEARAAARRSRSCRLDDARIALPRDSSPSTVLRCSAS